ncbi:MAG: glycosyltransferase family 2 protein [Phormidesmis sp.]
MSDAEKISKLNQLKTDVPIAGLSIQIEYAAPPAVETERDLEQPAPSLPPLYFLSVNYYSAALISDLMHSLEANQGIVIVNNSPADRVVHGLAGQTYAGGRVTVLDAADNDGFGAGCNLGLQWIYARSPQALVWLINPDTQLLPNAVSTVRHCFSQRQISILGTPILDIAGKLWFGSGRFNRWTGSVSSHHQVTNAMGRPMRTRWVSGCSMVLNLALIGHCPQFDEAYFLYYEDCDLCERYYRQGYEIAIAPIPLVVHDVSSITGRHTQPKYMHATFSKLTFLRRHASPIAVGLNLLYFLMQSLWLRLKIGGAEDRAAARGRWLGLMHFVTAPRTRPPSSFG